MSDERDTRIEAKIDKVMEHIGSIDVTIAKLTVSVDEHVRRTNLLEETIDPIKKSYDTRVGIGKILLFLATIGAGIEGFILLIQWLKK
jgi:hypothetical protein